jgi:hypothetical protein
MAGNMLDHTNQARAALANGDKARAIRAVDRAQADLQQIQAHAKGSTEIPVYREFVSISILKPVEAEQKMRQANGNKATVVHQVAGDYTDVSVDTSVAQTNLSAAKTALQQGNLKLADRALADVQEGVSIDEVEASMPLARARENLILARTAAENGKYYELRAALNAACSALDAYSTESGSYSQQAKSLAQEIRNSANKLQNGEFGVVAKINAWWNTTSAWTAYKPARQLSAQR